MKINFAFLILIAFFISSVLCEDFSIDKKEADVCSHFVNCEACTSDKRCSWCWDQAIPTCGISKDPHRCCKTCKECHTKIVFKSVSLLVVIMCGVIILGTLLLTISYSLYEFYWKRRYDFEVLQ